MSHFLEQDLTVHELIVVHGTRSDLQTQAATRQLSSMLLLQDTQLVSPAQLKNLLASTQ
jgi:hypothetical protein